MGLIQKAIEKELSRMLGTDEVAKETSTPNLKICVLDRSWVVVGRVSYEDGFTVIRNAAVVRNWGTSRGLGEIASGGPTGKTILDECPTVRARNVIFEMDCEEAKWNR